MKKVIFVILILIAGGGITAWYLYTKPVADMNEMKAEHSLSSAELFNSFNDDEERANKKYLGKIVEVTGKVRELKSDDEGQTLILETEDMLFGVNCGLSKGQKALFDKITNGQKVTVRGECTGISMDVVLVRCVLVNGNEN